MGMYEIQSRTYETKNFFAGDFPTLPESGLAGGKLEEHTPVAKDADGKIVAVTAETVANVVGITAAEAEAEEPVVYYMTGEFFEEALNLPEGVTIENIKEPLRKISIFLRTLN